MLYKHDSIQRDQLEMITLDQLVQQTIWFVKWKLPLTSLSFRFSEDMYSEVGRPSIDPAKYVKLTFIQYTFSIRSCVKQLKEG
ncbi:hypothetical protein Q8G35_15835 [Peribacillus simplex]|uniref:Transposase InsH N-terminal domain-containing protein n=2 Tax=Peribacillus TaxID=2675229 RepID=A0AA90P6G7_9BACI|nr:MULTISPECIES: hypothetical protein [Peribacillus]MDP1419821.1 hypothetical protein [Peribacillus simplex]MDP1453061.1 hypothetical protein [Peribacillus frigoritolerans]